MRCSRVRSGVQRQCRSRRVCRRRVCPAAPSPAAIVTSTSLNDPNYRQLLSRRLIANIVTVTCTHAYSQPQSHPTQAGDVRSSHISQ